MAAFTVRVADDVATKLEQLAEIEAGLAEADRGEFATDAELASVIEKYVELTHKS